MSEAPAVHITVDIVRFNTATAHLVGFCSCTELSMAVLDPYPTAHVGPVRQYNLNTLVGV